MSELILENGSCFIQICAFHACYFCSRVRLLARDISQISIKRDSQHRELQRGPSFPLLIPASARRASNCSILREIRENNRILTRKSHYFWLRAGIISTTFTSKQRNTTNDYVHTLREAPADIRGVSLTISEKKLKCCVRSPYVDGFFIFKFCVNNTINKVQKGRRSALAVSLSIHFFS